ncbi:MAG: hypothetical protein OEY27_01455, partial [Gammaproteobacteria bacterium]|nr:hypothetical protein [Gammaproteobacteria bacterium]
MNDVPSAPGEPARRGNPVLHQAKAWIVCGRRLVLEQNSLWYGMAAVYIVLGFLLTLIPFMGHLLLILITPMLLASVIWGRAQEPHGPPAPATVQPVSAQALLQTWIAQPAQELMRIFTQEDKIFGAVLLGIITLGLVMTVKIAGYLLIGGSMISGLTAGPAGGFQITMLLGMVLVVALSVLLAMGLFYCVPLTVLGNRRPLDAVTESFITCRQNARTLLPLVLPFFLVYLVIVAAFARSDWLGILLLISVGLLTLPLFV